MLSNPSWLAISLAIAFEVGAAASLASLITLEKMNKGIVWGLFIILTLMQAMGNTFYAFTHLANFQGWIELFGLVDEELIYQKRVLSIVSGAILPIVALGFIKSLVDYIKPADDVKVAVNDQITDAVTQVIKSESITEYPESEPTIEEPSMSPEIEEQQVPDSRLDETTTTTTRPRIDKHKSVDDLIARGLPLSGVNSLKRPFEP
jgi:hypothetical protein